MSSKTAWNELQSNLPGRPCACRSWCRLPVVTATPGFQVSLGCTWMALTAPTSRTSCARSGRRGRAAPRRPASMRCLTARRPPWTGFPTRGGVRIGYLTYTRRFAAGPGDLAGEASAAIAGRWCGRSQLDSHDACLTTFDFHDGMHLDGCGLCDVRALSAADGRAGFLCLSREETVVAGAR